MPSAEHEGITGVTFDSDGHRLLGTLYLARGCTPKPTALLLHGCPGLQQNADLAVALRDRGWNSLVFHYRGCWGSGGDYDLRTIPRDVTAAVDHLQDGGYPGVDPARLELTRFLATTPAEFIRQRDEVTGHLVPVDVVRSISPRPLLIVHGTDDRWVPAEHAGRLRAHAGQPSHYVEIDGANHDFAWHRGQLRELVCSWLDGTDV